MTARTPSHKKQAFRKAGRASQSEWLVQQVVRQKKALRSLIGIGASGFTDISREHDTYLHEKS